MLSFRISWSLLFLTIIVAFSDAQKKCDPEAPCMEISQCPAFNKLSEDETDAGKQRVKSEICGIVARKPLVCCPPVSDDLRSTTPEVPVGGAEEHPNLLPSKCGIQITADKIVGGTPAPMGAYPWMVALFYSDKGSEKQTYRCAGSLISSKYVLTAAHCVDPRKLVNRKIVAIHLGDWDLSTPKDCRPTSLGLKCAPPHIVAGFEKIVIHPSYNVKAETSDDVALIRLNITVDFDSHEADVQPICLPKKSLNLRDYVGKRDPIAAGWGQTEESSFSNILLRVKLPIEVDKKCKRTFPDRYIGNQICVGGRRRSDSCLGDSGAPLVVSEEFGPPFTQIGIVSFGTYPCGLKGIPGVYVNLKNFVDWIKDNLEP